MSNASQALSIPFQVEFTFGGNNYHVRVDTELPDLLEPGHILFHGPGAVPMNNSTESSTWRAFHINETRLGTVIETGDSYAVPLAEAASMAFALLAERALPPLLNVGAGVWMCFRQAAQMDDDGEFMICVRDLAKAQIGDCEPVRIEQLRSILRNIPFPSSPTAQLT